MRAPVARTLLAGLVASCAVVAAAAYVSVSGAGTGTGGTGTVGSITLSAATPDDPLYPGQTATVSLTAQNPDAYEVRIGSLALDTSQGSSGFARSSGSTSCTLTAFTFATQSNGGDGWVVPPRSTLAISLTDALTASASTANACQNAGLTVYLRAVA